MSKTKRGMQKFNSAYQQDIIFRMLGEDESKMQQFHGDYCEKRKKNGWGKELQPATKTDLQIYKDFQKGMLLGELQKKYERSYSRIQSSIVRAVHSLPSNAK